MLAFEVSNKDGKGMEAESADRCMCVKRGRRWMEEGDLF